MQQNPRQGGHATESGRTGLQIKNHIQSQAMRQSIPNHGRSKNNGAVTVRIAASSGIRHFNARVPVSQMKTSTDRKSVEGRLRIARPQNPPQAQPVFTEAGTNNHDSHSVGRPIGAAMRQQSDSRSQFIVTTSSAVNLQSQHNHVAKSGIASLTATKPYPTAATTDPHARPS